jgi:hypothetical protein
MKRRHGSGLVVAASALAADFELQARRSLWAMRLEVAPGISLNANMRMVAS